MTADGPEAVQRDAAMLAKAQQGGNVLDSENDASAVWDEYRVVFGYDCEDEADDWWVQWGVLRERARGSEDGSDAESYEEEDENEGEEESEAEMLGPRSSNLASLLSRHAKTPSGPPFRRACLNKSLGCYGSTLVLPSSAGTLFRVPRRCQRKSWQPYSLSLRPIGCLVMLHRTMDGVMISDGYK